MVISGLLTPLITGRWRLNHLLAVSQFGKFLLLLFLVMIFSIRLSVNRLILIDVVVIMIALLDGLAEPVSAALIPHYVSDAYLVKANSLLGGAYQLLGIGGWAIGSTLLAFFQIDQLLIFGVIVAAVASGLMLALPNVDQPLHQQVSWDQFTSGWKVIKNSRLLQVVTAMDLLETAANTVWVSAIILVFVHQVLQVSSTWWGYINAIYMLGAFLGSWGCYSLAKRLEQHTIRVIGWGALISSAIMLLVAVNHLPIVTLLLAMLFGVSSAMKNVPQTTLVQKNVSNDQLVVVYALQNVLYTGTYSLATLTIGWLSDTINVQFVFLIAAGLLFIVAILSRQLTRI